MAKLKISILRAPKRAQLQNIRTQTIWYYVYPNNLVLFVYHSHIIPLEEDFLRFSLNNTM